MDINFNQDPNQQVTTPVADDNSASPAPEDMPGEAPEQQTQPSPENYPELDTPAPTVTTPTLSAPAAVAEKTDSNDSPEEIQKLTDQLMEDLNLKDASNEDKQEVLNGIKGRVNDTILLTLLENLSEIDAQELEEKLKGGASEEDALEFLASKADGYSDKFADALAGLYTKLKEASK